MRWYFIDKNERGESSLYALSDLKVREDATFNKDYLQGNMELFLSLIMMILWMVN